MIKGIGVDISKISRFERIIKTAPYLVNFLNKVLHKNEILEFNALKNDEQKSKFLASRWSVKEALVKATNNKQLIYSNIFIWKDSNGKPFIKFDEDYQHNEQMGKVHLSISHEEDTSIAFVIIENNLI
jgi:phosphopantetheine--protein transferase-like protein